MKKFLSVILAALILVCPLSGFAAQTAQTLEWYFCDDLDYCDPWIYNCRGVITLGETEIKFTEDEYFDYYTFDAETAGYYYVECNDYQIEWFGFPEGITDGKAIRVAEATYVAGSNVKKKAVYKLNAGETVFGIDFNEEASAKDNYKVNIEYLGNAVTDIILDEGALDNLVIDVDIYNYDTSYAPTDIDVVFSGGKTVTFPDEWVQIDDADYNWTKGENEATATFMNFEKSVTVTACEMSDIVTDVEFVNVDEYKNVVTSFNDFYVDDIYGAELVLTLADGSKINVNTYYDDTVEINGREYYPYAYYVFNEAEDVDIEVAISGALIETYECNVTKSSYVEGSGILFSDIGEKLKDSFYYSRVAFSEFLTMYDAEDFEDTLYDAFYYFERSFRSVSYCFTLIEMFINYYF